jgi:hypothetical protein
LQDQQFPGSLLVVAGLENGVDEWSVVEIQDLQPAGKRRMSAAEFLRGRSVKKGDRMGPEPA